MAGNRGLHAFFEAHLGTLEARYSWPIPDDFLVQRTGNSYRDNVALKFDLRRRWEKADSEDRVRIANSVVKDWGGVNGNKPDTIRRYVDQISAGTMAFPLAGVASYSKILSITDPRAYAIYDARVAVALNAAQFIYQDGPGTVFNYIAGRNKTTGNSTTRAGFAYTPQFRRADLEAAGWVPIKRNETYAAYLDLLRATLVSFPDFELYDLEMCLFSSAEELATKAMGMV